jgi:hypothetical protein
MLLVSSDRTFQERKNIDDQLGSRVDIPTVIIRKDEGDEIRTYMSLNASEKVVMSIKFSGMKSSDSLTIELFMRSDNLKSLHFFKEFRQYYDKLSKKIQNFYYFLIFSNYFNIFLESKVTFVPRYKYYKYPWEETSNTLGAGQSTAACVKDTKYCAHENHSKFLKLFFN